MPRLRASQRTENELTSLTFSQHIQGVQQSKPGPELYKLFEHLRCVAFHDWLHSDRKRREGKVDDITKTCARLRKNQRLLHHLSKIDWPLSSKSMTRWNDSTNGNIESGKRPYAGRGGNIESEPNIHFTGDYRSNGVRRAIIAKMDMNTRMLCKELRDNFRQWTGSKPHSGNDGNFTSVRGLQPLDPCFHPLIGFQHLANVLDAQLPSRRELEPTWHSFEDGSSKFFFKSQDLTIDS